MNWLSLKIENINNTPYMYEFNPYPAKVVNMVSS